MKRKRFQLNRKFLLRLLGGIAIVLVLCVAAVFIYVHVNRERFALLLKDRLEQLFDGQVNIEKVKLSVFEDFPFFSLTMLNTTVKDSVCNESLLDIEKIHLRVNIFDLLQRRINVRAVTLENGSVFLFRDGSGYSNMSMFNREAGEKESAQMSFVIKQFVCKNIAFVYEQQEMGKRFSIRMDHVKGNVVPHGDEIDFVVAGTVHTDSLLFKRGKGSYLQGKDVQLDALMVYNKLNRELTIKPSGFMVDGQKFGMNGCFIMVKPFFLNLHIDNAACDFNITKTALTPKIQESLASFSVPEPVRVRINISGEASPGLPPMVDVYMGLSNQAMQAYKLDFTDMTMSAVFSNHLIDGLRNDNQNSGIFLAVESGKMEYLPFTANITITDLEKLNCRADWKTRMDLTDFNIHEVFDDFYFHKGIGALQFSYRGELSAYKDSIAVGFDDTLRGFLSVKDAVLEYPARQLSVTNIDASVIFNEEEFHVECLYAMLNGNRIELTGEMSGVRRLVTDEVDKMRADFEFTSPSFDISKVLLGKNESVAVSQKKTEKKGFTFLPALVSRITNDMTFDVKLKTDTLHFRDLTAHRVTGDLRLSSRGLALKDVKMHTCKGDLRVNALLDTRSKTDKLTVDADVRNVDVKQFFRSTDNLDQDAITHENLSGKLTSNVQFSARLDSKYNPITDSIRAKIFFSLKEGELTDYAPVAEIDNFIFRKRDMKNILFAEISDTLTLNGRELSITRMEVASSVIRLFIKGKYTFNGPTEIYVQVPLRNLRKPDADAAMKNFRLDERPGASIFLKVHGEAGNLKVSLSPAGRKELKGEKEEEDKDKAAVGSDGEQ